MKYKVIRVHILEASSPLDSMQRAGADNLEFQKSVPIEESKEWKQGFKTQIFGDNKRGRK